MVVFYVNCISIFFKGPTFILSSKTTIPETLCLSSFNALPAAGKSLWKARFCGMSLGGNPGDLSLLEQEALPQDSDTSSESQIRIHSLAPMLPRESRQTGSVLPPTEEGGALGSQSLGQHNHPEAQHRRGRCSPFPGENMGHEGQPHELLGHERPVQSLETRQN